MQMPVHIVAAGGIVENEQGEVLVVKTRWKSKWVFPGGQVEGHSGVETVPTKVMFDFVCKPIGGELAASDETSESRWVAKQDVLGLVTSPALRTRYQAYLDFNGQVQYMDYVTQPQFELKLKRGV